MYYIREQSRVKQTLEHVLKACCWMSYHISWISLPSSLFTPCSIACSRTLRCWSSNSSSILWICIIVHLQMRVCHLLLKDQVLVLTLCLPLLSVLTLFFGLLFLHCLDGCEHWACWSSDLVCYAGNRQLLTFVGGDGCGWGGQSWRKP